MKKNLFSSLAAVSLITYVFASGCKPDPDFSTPEEEQMIEFVVPKGWPQPKYAFQNNELTKEGFELGRKLFFDHRLSRDNSTSCGSCHQPFAAFAQAAHDVSHGVENRLGTRNSPPLFNLNWHTGFMWDGGVNHIEVQPINPIQNPVEMDETIDNVVAKLQADAKYKAMFKNAFGDETINSQRILKSMAQFMGMLVSSNSRYDKYVRGEDGGNMTTTELAGLSTFKAKCASCHSEPLFTDLTYKNNGLKPTVVDDTGRAVITADPADKYKFKVPSLRNLKYTYPYMHDGRFQSLDAVLNHYATGVHQSATLEPELKNGIQLNSEEKNNLLQFLNTLNDETFIKDKRFQEVTN